MCNTTATIDVRIEVEVDSQELVAILRGRKSRFADFGDGGFAILGEARAFDDMPISSDLKSDFIIS